MREEGVEEDEKDVKGRRIKVQKDGRPITQLASKPLHQEGGEEEMQGEEATLYRSVVARLNYLSPDRQDIVYAVRECAKGMANPKQRDLVKLKRICRYLLGAKAVKMHLWVQAMPNNIEVHTDCDWAGCKRTRISVSGEWLGLATQW